MRAETIVANVRMSDRPFAELVAQYPAALTYGPGHLEARFMLADLGLSAAKTGALLVIPTRKADALLIVHFRSTAASSAAAERAIQALRERDIIKKPG